MLKRTLMALVLLLSGCGYHLAGQGEGGGAVPEEVRTVTLQAIGAGGTLLTELHHRLATGTYRWRLVAADTGVTEPDTHATLRLEQVSERFVPSAYDTTGVAIQYRLTLSGNLRLFRTGELIWESGIISESGDVYVVGGPSGVEASKARLSRELSRQWANRAVQRLRSGF